MTLREAERLFEAFCLPTIGVSFALARRAAELRTITRAYGLSMGDRICLATAESIGATAVTADRQWAAAGLPVAIELIR
jgi:PIN domain nuclease of toxin-antitoxin system